MTETVMQRLQALDPYSALMIESVALERLRQIESEGWTPDHDDRHDKGEMAAAASCYAANACLAACAPETVFKRGDIPPAAWMWAREWWKPNTAQHDLKRAGALIIAEAARRMRRSSTEAFSERMDAAKTIEAQAAHCSSQARPSEKS